jgi:hypothetical protein
MKKAAKARRWPGLAARCGSSDRRATMPPRFVVSARRASAKTARITVGSASAATATSRLAPMPPKALPESRPARARKKLPTRKRYMRRMIPANGRAVREATTGTITAATSMVANST